MADLGERIEAAFIKGIQDAGEAIYRESQRRVPVITGQLKRSGYVRKLPDGVEIGYRAPYAFSVEHGDPRYNRSRKRLARPQDVSSASIFSRGPLRRRPRIDPRGKPRHYMKSAVGQVLPRWGKIVGARLQKTFSR